MVGFKTRSEGISSSKSYQSTTSFLSMDDVVRDPSKLSPSKPILLLLPSFGNSQHDRGIEPNARAIGQMFAAAGFQTIWAPNTRDNTLRNDVARIDSAIRATGQPLVAYLHFHGGDYSAISNRKPSKPGHVHFGSVADQSGTINRIVDFDTEADVVDPLLDGTSGDLIVLMAACESGSLAVRANDPSSFNSNGGPTGRLTLLANAEDHLKMSWELTEHLDQAVLSVLYLYDPKQAGASDLSLGTAVAQINNRGGGLRGAFPDAAPKQVSGDISPDTRARLGIPADAHPQQYSQHYSYWSQKLAVGGKDRPLGPASFFQSGDFTAVEYMYRYVITGDVVSNAKGAAYYVPSVNGGPDYVINVKFTPKGQ
jgi:hypothetical protein